MSSAFPYSFTTLLGEDVYDSGMTLRDWFAGQALTGLLAGDSHPDHPEQVAVAAYWMADLMLKERGEP